MNKFFHGLIVICCLLTLTACGKRDETVSVNKNGVLYEIGEDVSFYYPQDFVSADFDVYWSYISPQAVAITPGLIRYLSGKARPWPDIRALYTAPGTIILTVTSEGNARAQNWLEQQTKSASFPPL